VSFATDYKAQGKKGGNGAKHPNDSERVTQKGRVLREGRGRGGKVRDQTLIFRNRQ